MTIALHFHSWTSKKSVSKCSVVIVLDCVGEVGAAAAHDEHHSAPQQKNFVTGQDAHGGLCNVQVPQGPQRRVPEQLRGF